MTTLTPSERDDLDRRLSAIDAILAKSEQLPEAVGNRTKKACQAICIKFGVKYMPTEWREGFCNMETKRWGVNNGYIEPYVEGVKRHGDMPRRYVR